MPRFLGLLDANGTGEVPRANVVGRPPPSFAAETSDIQPNVGISEEDIEVFAGRSLARYEHLEGGIQFVEQIPRKAMGKFVKSKLLDRYHINGHG